MIVKTSSCSTLEEYQVTVYDQDAQRQRKHGILELRKEKSRDAARSRRGKENYEFYELAKLLPLPAAITSQLDKASIIRLTISYLKLRDFSCHGDPQWTQEGGPGVNKINKGHQSRLDIIDPFESRQGTHILQSLDGFAFILASDGRFLYISETVSIYLGLSQVEMAGSSIFDYVHPQDHTELAEHLGMCLVPTGPSGSPHGSGSDDGSSPATPRPGSPTEKGYMMVQGPDKNPNKSFSLRMKSTLTKRGVHVKTTGYRVVHVLGTLRPQSTFGLARSSTQNSNNNNNNNNSCNNGNSSNSSASGGGSGGGSGSGGTGNNGSGGASSEPPLLGLVGMAIALPPPTITELRLEVDTFITRLSPDFKVIYCEPIISDLMDLTVEDCVDRLLYDLCHVADLKSLRRSHGDILNKGQALTDYYRLVNRHGGYVWVQTCATTLLNSKNSDDQSILAINYVVSGIEGKNCAMDLWQVTGDAGASMSSTSKSRFREEKLKELKTCKLTSGQSIKGKTRLGPSSGVRTASFSPNSQQATDRADISKNEGKSSPSSSSPKASYEPSVEDGEDLSPEKNSVGIDGKNKRRKMENPRKRKKSSSDSLDMDPPEKALNLTRSGSTASIITETSQSVAGGGQNAENVLSDNRVSATATSSLSAEDVTSSSPEDLSMKTSMRKSPERSIIKHSSGVFRGGGVSPDSDRPKATATTILDAHDNSSSPVTMTGSSVKDLEAAMNRHLPASSSSSNGFSQNERNSFDMALADSTGIAGKGFSGLPNSGIAPNPSVSSSSWLPSSRVSGPDVLTASNFLRSLYANRESVIKTSTRSQAPFMNQEPPTSLLTPPEPDPTTYRDHGTAYSYGKPDALSHAHIYDKDMGVEQRDHFYKDQTARDQYSFIPYKDHIPSAYIDHISSSVYKDHLASTYKDLSPYKDIIPAFTIPSLMSPTGRMHQAYPSFHPHFTVPITTATMDACSITPPSSNSPDVHKHPPSQQFDAAGFSNDLTNACNLSQKQVLSNSLPATASPTSTHIYHPTRHHKDQLYQGVGVGVEVSSGDPAKGAYYGVTAAQAGSMYMDLSQGGPGAGQYETCTRPVLPWY